MVMSNNGFRRVYQVNDYSQLTPNQKRNFNQDVANLRAKLPSGFRFSTNFQASVNKGNLYNAARLIFPHMSRNNRNLLINKVIKYKKPTPRSSAKPTEWKTGSNANAILRNALDKGRISEIITPYFTPATRVNSTIKKIWGVNPGYFKNVLNKANRKGALIGANNRLLYGFALMKNRNRGRYLDVLGAIPGYGPLTMSKIIGNASTNRLNYVSLKAVVSNPTITRKRTRGKYVITKNSVGNKLTNWYMSPAGGAFTKRGGMVKGNLQPMVKYLTHNTAAVNAILNRQKVQNAANNAAARKAARKAGRAARPSPQPAPPPTRVLRTRP